MPDAKKTRRLLVIGGSTVVAVLLSAAAGFHFFFDKPEGTGPAGPKVPREAFRNVWSPRQVLLVGLGDSVTAGFGARRGYSYFDRLVANPPDEFADLAGINLRVVFPNLTVTNLSLSGSTSPQHAAKQIPRLTLAPTNVFGLVVMTTGGNDIIHDYGRGTPHEGAMYGASLPQAEPWITNFEHRLDTMLDVISAAFPGGCRIFLASIYDPTDGIGDIENAGAGLPRWKDGLEIHRRYNEVIARVAARHSNTRVVDMRREFLGHGIHCTKFWSPHFHKDDPHHWYHANLEDPNERGYDVLRRIFLIEMAKVFASPASR
ncbi:MAG: SGNH/GDSL hydrolase family protein [Verrucomicrobia bacterium]|nr:SGNH/GDSL hydrolase family protein [Verrucomicrobiota bacterium]